MWMATMIPTKLGFVEGISIPDMTVVLSVIYPPSFHRRLKIV